jgi:hypothetical protein
LLKPDAYEDGSGWDWSKYSTKTNPEPWNTQNKTLKQP